MAAYATVVAALDAVDQPSAATRARVSVVQDGDTMTVQVEVTGGDGIIVAPDCTDAADRVGALGGHLTFRSGREWDDDGDGGDPMRVVVADDVMLVRSGLARLLSDAGVEVVGEAADADELLRMVALDQPDVAIVDIRMPPTHTDEGLVAARRIRQRYPTTAVVLLSQYLAGAPSGCSPTSPVASATCSRNVSPMSPCWSTPCAGSPRASAWSTPRSWPDSCSAGVPTPRSPC